MNRGKRWLVGFVLGVLAATFGAGTVLAGEAQIYDWHGDEAPVLIKNSSGVILLGTDGGILRAFSWRENEDSEFDRAVRITDVSGDNSAEIVGSGVPTFVLDANGIPVFSLEEGCQQVVLADFIRGTRLDVVCVRRDQVRVYTGDGQFAWSVGTSRGIDRCRAGDLTNDTNDELECKMRGAERYLRIRADGETMTDSGETERLEGVTESHPEPEPVAEAVWTGGERFDIDGDGRAAETIQAEEGVLMIRKDGGDEPLATIDIDGDLLAALIKDLDGEGDVSIVAITARSIYVISDGGEEVARISADASDYRRVPHAELSSVHANNFGDEQQAAQQAVEDIQDRIAQCYAARVRAHPYAGSGRQLLQVTVAEDGSVERVMQRHADVGDREVEQCARNAVEGVTFPATAGGQGTVSVNIMFSFRDE